MTALPAGAGPPLPPVPLGRMGRRVAEAHNRLGPLREILLSHAEPTPEQIAFVGEVVAGAYFLDERVRDLIGYHGRRAVPIPSAPDHSDLIGPVVERGPRYRPTP